ncbi:MAG TPA: sigma-70 family RNA polymerase sigma factor [Gemmataceae bacterium]|jgi:RNA polymerase sigma-70 factor (ECF subfamily)|nr:sigma-70 family RNA polymerase sigma factor [Gemmataceae bacterium]
METSASLLDRLHATPTEADWRRLHDLYRPLLEGWCLRAGLSRADADDLTQDVLVAVVRQVGMLDRPGAGSFRGWLRTVLSRRIIDHLRRQAVRPVAASGMNLEDLAGPDSDLSRRWDREHDVHVARQAMRVVEVDFAPPTWRAFRRQVIDGAPAAEVAAEVGITLNAAILAKSRVLKRLRQEVAGLIG